MILHGFVAANANSAWSIRIESPVRQVKPQAARHLVAAKPKTLFGTAGGWL